MNRQKVYELIDTEREYQDVIRPKIMNDDVPDANKSVADFIIYIEYHISKAKKCVYFMNNLKAMEEIRKITALGVAAMETHDTPARIVEPELPE